MTRSAGGGRVRVERRGPCTTDGLGICGGGGGGCCCGCCCGCFRAVLGVRFSDLADTGWLTITTSMRGVTLKGSAREMLGVVGSGSSLVFFKVLFLAWGKSRRAVRARVAIGAESGSRERAAARRSRVAGKAPDATGAAVILLELDRSLLGDGGLQSFVPRPRFPLIDGADDVTLDAASSESSGLGDLLLVEQESADGLRLAVAARGLEAPSALREARGLATGVLDTHSPMLSSHRYS